MLYVDFRQHVLAVLKDVLADKGLVEADFAPVNVEAPKEAAHGDLATNAAMVLAKKVGLAPRALAEMLVDGFAKHEAVDAVEIAGPGFINFQLKTAALIRQGIEVVKLDGAYGKLTPADARKALVEYVSINPTGPIHVGHGRNAVFGDAIANVLEKAGYPVWREYLINDAGNQISILVKSLHARYLQLFGKDVAVPENGYPGEYLIEIAEKLKARDGDKWVSETDDVVLTRDLREFAVETCLDLIKADIETLGIKFDLYFSEFAMHQTDRMVEVVQILRDKGLVYEGTLPPPKGKEIADYQPVELTLFKATEFGLADDQPIYNRAGKPTYFGQDIAYHYDKLQRGYELLVTVIGIDQAGSFKPLSKAIEALTGRGDAYHPVPYEMVKVMRNGEPVKLSKRAGNIVLLSDVLEEVGTDAFRFTMLTVKPTTPLLFDLAHAVAKTMDNPVFYVQYAHARLCAVERQRGELGIAAVNFAELNAETMEISEDARGVLREVMLYPALIEQTARALEPHRLTFYAQSLAAAVHRWYASEKWLDANNVTATHTRLAVASAARTVLADVLKLCGVNAPTSM